MTNPYENTPGAGDSAPLPQQAPQPQVRADQGIVPSVEYVAPPTPVQSAPAQPYPGQPYAPAVPGPPYAGQPDAPYPVPVQQPTGASSWAMGFLAFIPIPFLNVLITGIAMASMYPSVRKKGVPLATENARIAANWGLTLIASHVVLVVLLIALQSARTFRIAPRAPLGSPASCGGRPASHCDDHGNGEGQARRGIPQRLGHPVHSCVEGL